ncbi:MAG: choice-of-anchor B family protein, partial [Planctomycetota bacterium]
MFLRHGMGRGLGVKGLGISVASVLLISSMAWGQFASSNVTLTDRLPLSQIGGGTGSDIWGWTDPDTGREYALMGRSNGVSFVDVTDPFNAVYLGNLPPAPNGGSDDWRDIKTYGNYAYIVADGNVGPHGLQVFDLTRLRGVTTPQTFTTDFNENSFRNAHNIAINEESGYAYVLGSNLDSGRAQVYDLSNPAVPEYVTSISPDAYIHDAQVVNYRGPDQTYAGREVMFTGSVNDLVIIDVEDKNAPFRIWESQPLNPQPYDVGYIHQGWLSEDHTIFYMNDELDDNWTHIWDVSDLDNPVYKGHLDPLVGNSIDHNLYVKGNYVYEANYTSGLRVFEITDPVNGTIDEVAWLDTFPSSNGGFFDGAWSVYPYFDSGTIITSDISGGLFVARVGVLAADFDGDGRANCTDIDQLVAAVANQTGESWFDLTGDGLLSVADVEQWLEDAGMENIGAAYLPGDANLDGIVDGADFLAWNDHKFSDVAAWCSGDFNADG